MWWLPRNKDHGSDDTLSLGDQGSLLGNSLRESGSALKRANKTCPLHEALLRESGSALKRANKTYPSHEALLRESGSALKHANETYPLDKASELRRDMSYHQHQG